MQNYYNQRAFQFNKEQREEYLDYLKKTGRIIPRVEHASNHNPDNLTGKIGQESKFIRLPQTYFSRKYNGTLQPIDDYYIEHRNNFNDFYPLGIYDELYRKPYDPNLHSTRILNTYDNYYKNLVNYGVADNTYNSQNNFSNSNIHVSKSMDHFDLNEYQKKINEREKQFYDNYNNQKQFPESYDNNTKSKNMRYVNNDRYIQNEIHYTINKDNPCKIFFLFF